MRVHDCTAAAAGRGTWHHPGVSALGIHHVGIAVRDLDLALKRYERLFGARVEAREHVEAQGVEAVALLVGEAGRIELLAPLADDTPVGRFLARRGEGMHHLAFGVADLPTELARLRAAGATLIDEQPRRGIYGAVAFVHHESLGGVLSELVQAMTATEA
jgi:methylmalonyl-CoA/ethylmalonyl-CoA epimerase